MTSFARNDWRTGRKCTERQASRRFRTEKVGDERDESMEGPSFQ